MTPLSLTLNSFLRKVSLLSFSLLICGLGLSVQTAEAQPWGGGGWCPPTGCEGSMNVSGPFGACPGNLVTCPVSGHGCMMGQSGNCCAQSSVQESGSYSYVCESSGGGGDWSGDCSAAPFRLSASCNSAGTQAIIDFGTASGWGSLYALRVDADPTSWNNTCARVNPGDVCTDISAPNYILNTIPGHTYNIWVHPYFGCHGGASFVAEDTFQSGTLTCAPPPPPAPTVSLTVSQTTNTGNTAGNGGSITIPSNQTATLSWQSTNAVSCTATGNWAGAKGAVSGQAYTEATGPLAGGITYTYNLQCTNSAGVSVANSVRVVVNLPLVDPVSIATCSPAGNSVTLSWNSVPTASVYPLRINDTVDPWGPGPGQGCAFSTSLNDTCLDSIVTLSYTRPVVPGHTYQAWMHSCRPGECSPGLATIPYPFRCDAPIPPPVATLDLNPSAINIHPTVNGNARLTWGSSGNATSCTGTNFNTNGALSGSLIVSPGSQTTYSVFCTGPGGNSPVVSRTLNVFSTCVPAVPCENASDICKPESCTDSCGEKTIGTKDCRRFWKEVAP